MSRDESDEVGLGVGKADSMVTLMVMMVVFVMVDKVIFGRACDVHVEKSQK